MRKAIASPSELVASIAAAFTETGITAWPVYDAEAWRYGRYPPPWEDSPVWACVTWQATAETGQLAIEVSKAPWNPEKVELGKRRFGQDPASIFAPQT
jgi:hypothetical protein